MNYKQFSKQNTYNVDQVRKYLNSGRQRHLDEVIFDNGKKSYQLGFTALSKNYDILASCLVGAIPIAARTGADAFIINSNGAYEPIEVKVSTFNPEMIRRGVRGGLYYVGDEYRDHAMVESKNRKGFNRYIAANYSADVVNRHRIDTYLVCLRQDTMQPVFGFRIPKNKIEEAYTLMESKVAKTITLTWFQSLGEEIELTLESPGYDCLIETMRTEARLISRDG